MSSITIICPNLRRHTVKVTPGTLLRTVVEEACLKSGYDVNCCEAKNLNKKVDLALPFRLSGLANNATLELSVVDKPTNENVELALQLPDGRRELLTIQLNNTLKDVLINFAAKLNEDLLSDSDGIPCCIYMGRKYIGPELEYTTLLSIGINGGKCLLRYQKVEISEDELAKLKEKALAEEQRIASLSTAYNTAKKQNEERDRIEAERLAKFEAEMKVKAQEEEARRQQEAREAAERQRETENNRNASTNGNVEVQQGSSQMRDILPDMPANGQNGGGWSFDSSPFHQQINALGYPEIAPPPPSRIDRLNALLERMDRSIMTGGSDNLVQIVADSGRMSLNQIEAASNVMDTEPALEGPQFDDPCPRNVVIFNRIEQDKEDPETATEIPDEFFDVGVADVKSLQKDLKNQVRLQTQRSLLPRSFLEKKNRELKMEAWKHSVIRLAVGDQFVQLNFKSGEPITRLFEEVSNLFKTKAEFTLTAILNEPVKKDETKNFVDSNLAPKTTLTLKIKNVTNPVSMLRDDIQRCNHADADVVSKEWLSINSIFKPYTGVVAASEEERPIKRAAASDYQSGSKPAAPAGPKWFKHK